MVLPQKCSFVLKNLGFFTETSIVIFDSPIFLVLVELFFEALCDSDLLSFLLDVT